MLFDVFIVRWKMPLCTVATVASDFDGLYDNDKKIEVNDHCTDRVTSIFWGTIVRFIQFCRSSPGNPTHLKALPFQYSNGESYSYASCVMVLFSIPPFAWDTVNGLFGDFECHSNCYNDIIPYVWSKVENANSLRNG